MINLDSASSEKIHPKAKKAMIDGFNSWINPSGLGQLNKTAKAELECSRNELKQIFNVKNNAQIIFTSSASESNNVIFNSSLYPILISKFEHPSIFKHPKVESTIELDEFFLEKKLKNKKYLVSLTLVNNESGMIICTQEIISIIHSLGSKVHVDASQAKEINFDKLNCDYMTISSHKIGGPVGIAGIITKTIIPTFIHGGGQEFNIRSGTEPLPLIKGFTAAARELSNRQKKNLSLNKYLKKLIDKKYFFSNFVDKVFDPHIVCLLTYSFSGTEVFAYMDINDIIISYGSACSSGTLSSPKILSIFDLPSKNGIRISFGWHTSYNDITNFASKWNEFFK